MSRVPVCLIESSTLYNTLRIHTEQSIVLAYTVSTRESGLDANCKTLKIASTSKALAKGVKAGRKFARPLPL